MKNILYILLFVLVSCNNQPHKIREEKPIASSTPPVLIQDTIHTVYSTSENEYLNFNSVDAINKIADIENEYFKDKENNVSRYYGTVWREQAEQTVFNDSKTLYEEYLNQLKDTKADSLHCTLYAYEGLKAGLTEMQLEKLEKIHKDIWKTREIAGWSIGYILVKYFDWQAYLFLDPDADEYAHCMKSYKKNKSYPVWKQPNIPLEEVYIIGKQDSLINTLLNQHEFSWGFSNQGIHTWITRYDTLKECNWLGVPSKKYEETIDENPLFITTDFKNYFDYSSHVIVVPKKRS